MQRAPLLSRANSINWLDVVRRSLSRESAARVAKAAFGYEADKNAHFIYVTRRHDGETIALPVDAGLTDDNLALLILFLG
jgi:hypothetical protein